MSAVPRSRLPDGQYQPRVSRVRPAAPMPEPGPFYWFMQSLPRWVWPLFGRLIVEGRDHIPKSGSFLLISNHQSLLDPFFIQTCIPRVCHPMAKSTQFASPAFAAVMKRCYAFPVRRFQVDPQAVRVALRRLATGYPVHIYVEGERSWDGTLQKPRAGTVRLALKAGVPIVPCAVSGAYDVWPRWARRVGRGDVRVAFGEPFRLPQLDDRRQRDAALADASTRIMSALSSLLQVPLPDFSSDDV
jgi:1-acyl-sn-glycerol-3-phosphate acyltransferase